MFSIKNDVLSLKLVDFGMATSNSVDSYLFIRCGTPGYIAPEIANLKQQKVKYDLVCDVFSIGALMFKLYTGQELFPGKDAQEIFYFNQRCLLYNLSNMEVTPNKLAKDLIKKMLIPDPKLRITSKDCL